MDEVYFVVVEIVNIGVVEIGVVLGVGFGIVFIVVVIGQCGGMGGLDFGFVFIEQVDYVVVVGCCGFFVVWLCNLNLIVVVQFVVKGVGYVVGDNLFFDQWQYCIKIGVCVYDVV